MIRHDLTVAHSLEAGESRRRRGGDSGEVIKIEEGRSAHTEVAKFCRNCVRRAIRDATATLFQTYWNHLGIATAAGQVTSLLGVVRCLAPSLDALRYGRSPDGPVAKIFEQLQKLSVW